MTEYRRTSSELKAIYSFEKSLRDIFVEGGVDKRIFDNYVRSKKLNGNFIPISTISLDDFDEAFTNGLDLSSNRNKVIALTRLLSSIPDNGNVKGVIDRDFDDYIASENNFHLWRTDYTCLESYFYCVEVKTKLIEIGLGTFPFGPALVLSEIGKVIRFLFGVRLWRTQNDKSIQLVQISKMLKVDKKSGIIDFDEDDYVQKLISKNKLGKECEANDEIRKIVDGLDLDPRKALNKYDYLEVLFLYVNKIKNTPNYRKEQFERLLHSSVEALHLEKFGLFKEIEGFVS